MLLISYLKLLWHNRWALRYLPKSIYFNFHYLPFKQAVHLPFLLRKARLLDVRGIVKIAYSGGVKFGMIRLGMNMVSLYPDSGVVFENHGGTIVFNGPCDIGAGSAISVGNKGKLEIGENFVATASFKLACYDHIKFEPYVSFGWDCIVMDTDFHCMKKVSGGYSKGYGEIVIGRGCWIGTRCMIMKNVMLPNHTTVSAGSKISKKMDIDDNCVIGTDSTLFILRKGVFRDHEHGNDVISF